MERTVEKNEIPRVFCPSYDTDAFRSILGRTLCNQEKAIHFLFPARIVVSVNHGQEVQRIG